MLVSRTVWPSEGRSYCGATLAIPISRLRLAKLGDMHEPMVLDGNGEKTDAHFPLKEFFGVQP
jgi:hypothetical protein